MKHAVVHPRRRGAHLRAAVDYLDTLGASNVHVTANGHLHVSWLFQGARMTITLSSSPSDVDGCAKIARQLIRRRLREAGLEVRA